MLIFVDFSIRPGLGLNEWPARFHKRTTDSIFDHRGLVPFVWVKADYVIYNKLDGHNGAKDGMRNISGTITIGGIASREKVIKATKMVNLNERDDALTFSRDSEQEPFGVWFKIYGPLLDGVPSVRDASFPSTLKQDFAWADQLFTTRDANSMLGVTPATDLDSMIDLDSLIGPASDTDMILGQ